MIVPTSLFNENATAGATATTRGAIDWSSLYMKENSGGERSQ